MSPQTDLLLSAAEDPKVTDWMQGWGSVLGVAVGLIASAATAALLVYEIRAGRCARAEAARDRAEAAQDRALAVAERRDAVAAQARTVVINGIHISNLRTGILKRFAFTVANYGSGPILDVHPQVVIDGDTVDRLKFRGSAALGPGEKLELEKRFQSAFAKLKDGEPMQDAELAEHITIEVRFTDMAGLRWLRQDSGQPQRILKDEP
ncbi:hypothetical protein [Plantactinospora endophytica]|uniref:Uncharacterized protein n=1 Tax=Plantactinospora endophytica TaxID=673535 RepID=A0ABQ4EEL1_9ACTN|nr:hypothetical protein [Plantactinospora endophytica]GIG93153.1 hypothetical protein Pen02_80890 [Plantactinospora endophytica]